ncbi:MAG: hypothetical protein KR126chlam4_00760 [Candidatus Anoxychlamydiales bacterium]|uniref:Uncharacterized protein n=1 Tax=marine sediment metagenome TaxID=412755 RepID=A0A0F9BCT3_9ZZZZ|nr:hypothetical protein [Candidatus Anoxychlamydiales bacterium]NGX40929.1 hypothetical protein [Candidatus Anoxychlamydiales bacterium]
MKIFFALIVLAIPFYTYPCPLTITNDTDHTVLLIDPNGPEAVLIPTKKSMIIDPTLTHPLMKYISNEQLDIYYTEESSPNLFYKRYRLTEKYCSDDPEKNKLTLSQILQFVDQPTKRFKVKKIQKTEKSIEHKHN